MTALRIRPLFFFLETDHAVNATFVPQNIVGAKPSAFLGLAANQWLEQGGRALSVDVLTQNRKARAFYAAMGARFVRNDLYHWDGHALDETIYLFDNLAQLARFA